MFSGLFLLIFMPASFRLGVSKHKTYLLAALLITGIALSGCGGGGGSTGTGGGGSTSGTPSGDYVVTVTAKSGTISQSSTLKLTVQ
jgi:hypothetical protein